ncbi:hypothetical protein [Williamsoniiplasma lucivorax]|uniref:Uncharacterized protein n=1 Tax=Williamsoniiplasma lucivorax TaxID=209274 RepID=A0A2S5RF22_9MOLU|nr:hypothetical protein [Williamsoniiplasma lucivorax]PPE05910.1 hypothetical protein ELUCI_v1c02000 [Williamsoniiplasma lucivorax]
MKKTNLLLLLGGVGVSAVAVTAIVTPIMVTKKANDDVLKQLKETQHQLELLKSNKNESINHNQGSIPKSNQNPTSMDEINKIIQQHEEKLKQIAEDIVELTLAPKQQIEKTIDELMKAFSVENLVDLQVKAKEHQDKIGMVKTFGKILNIKEELADKVIKIFKIVVESNSLTKDNLVNDIVKVKLTKREIKTILDLVPMIKTLLPGKTEEQPNASDKDKINSSSKNNNVQSNDKKLKKIINDLMSTFDVKDVKQLQDKLNEYSSLLGLVESMGPILLKISPEVAKNVSKIIKVIQNLKILTIDELVKDVVGLKLSDAEVQNMLAAIPNIQKFFSKDKGETPTTTEETNKGLKEFVEFWWNEQNSKIKEFNLFKPEFAEKINAGEGLEKNITKKFEGTTIDEKDLKNIIKITQKMIEPTIKTLKDFETLKDDFKDIDLNALINKMNDALAEKSISEMNDQVIPNNDQSQAVAVQESHF